MELAILVLFIILGISAIIDAFKFAKIEKRLEKSERQTEKDNNRIEQLDKTVTQLQLRLDMMSPPRRD